MTNSPVKGAQAYIPDLDNGVFEGHLRPGSVSFAKVGTTNRFLLAPGAVEGNRAVTPNAALLALIAAIPTTDPQNGVTIWNDEGVLKVASPA